MSDRIPGTSWDNPIWYRGYRIHIGPAYTRDSQWTYIHDDYDGAEDSHDRRYGFCATEQECRDEIDELEDELAAQRDPEKEPEVGLKEIGCPYDATDERALIWLAGYREGERSGIDRGAKVVSEVYDKHLAGLGR